MKKYAFLIFVFCVMCSFSFNNRKNITGIVRMVGTSMFPRILIMTDDEKEYFFDENLFNEYKKYVGERLTVSAVVKEKKLTLADGSKTFIEYILTDINVLALD